MLLIKKQTRGKWLGSTIKQPSAFWCASLFLFGRILWWTTLPLRSSFVRSCWMSTTCWPVWTSLLAFLCQSVEMLMSVSSISWLTRSRWRLTDNCWLMQWVYSRVCLCRGQASVSLNIRFIICANLYPRQRQSRGRVFTAVCLSVFPHDISKTDAARITKLDIQMFRGESWKPIDFGSKVKVTSQNKSCWSSDSTQYCCIRKPS